MNTLLGLEPALWLPQDYPKSSFWTNTLPSCKSSGRRRRNFKVRLFINLFLTLQKSVPDFVYYYQTGQLARCFLPKIHLRLRVIHFIKFQNRQRPISIKYWSSRDQEMCQHAEKDIQKNLITNSFQIKHILFSFSRCCKLLIALSNSKYNELLRSEKFQQ